jgi:dipeptidase E
MRLLLISNSTNPGEAYLDYPKNNIREFLGTQVKKTLFIPYAGVTFSFDDYTDKVQQRFDEIGYQVDPIHRYSDPLEAVNQAEAIVVGGGNTWQLTRMIHDNDLIDAVREKVLKGTPYVGWSAGSNLACPTIKTTNDMPIIDPRGFHGFNFIPFQINPHYLDANPDGHAGETREQRIEEFLVVNPDVYVLGLREGTMLKVINKSIELTGSRPARIFKLGNPPLEVEPGGKLDFLMK